MNEKIYWIALNFINISYPKLQKLLNEVKNLEEIFKLDKKKLIELGLSKNAAEKITKWEELPLKEEIRYIENEGINILTIKDPDYPILLKEIYDPPILFYYKGNINFNNNISIGIVGTRNPSIYGIKMAEKFAFELSHFGFTIVSGLARGIDTAAHTGALRANGKTIGVMGSGFKNFYPPENKKLEKDIIKNGAIITEYPSFTLPEKYNFPRRNRIISGLCKGVVIIEAGPKSGALITANFALEQGRDVFALPGRVDTLYSKGTNKLLKEGAILIENINDILDALNIEINWKNQIEEKIELETEEEKLIIKALERPSNIDEILSMTKIELKNLLSLLTKLQIKGLIEELPGKIYRKK
ncbi:MAG: DNA-processing protein DprA [Candidatus Omnitrophica bacterium]|nr:DNA-processing protein DprA [Candidatus Omnitrophota bacterium]MCM8809568.1 DNA-processing protein DprA [Candidatus Omnitrophota bacterium]MCM8810539.1 DNA-processing protein DprA [Candidatus Omnitrophota bacterium]